MKKQLLTIAATAGLFFTAFHGNASANENTYQVRSGDTLWKIAQSNNLSINQLVEWNRLTSTEIYPEQKLVVAPATAANLGNTYTVQSGDSLWIIATRYYLSITQLKSLNNLSSDTIYVGQVLKVSSDAASVPSKADQLVLEAKKYTGVPYKWGGSTPSAFDCSGFLNYVYNNVGVSIPRTVATIWEATKPVTAPRVGDIVFFNTATGPSHAGIYLGNNQFIHSGSSTGVTISDLSLSYWKTRYLGARTAL